MMTIKRSRPHRNLRTRQLGTYPLFRACSDKELEAIARNVTEQRVDAGRALIREGEVGREVFVIVEGTARVEVNGQVIARLGPGDVAGEVALLDRQCRTATVIAETDLVVEVSGTLEFAELLAVAPNMTRKLLAGLATRVRTADAVR